MLEIATTIIGGIFSVLWYLLKQKDDQQASQIKTLFEKHDADASALQDLRVQIAARHYERPELDAKFDKLEKTVSDGLASVSLKIDKLSDAITEHIRSGK